MNIVPADLNAGFVFVSGLFESDDIHPVSLLRYDRKGFIDIRHEFVIDSVLDGSNAQKAGIKKGDKFIALNDSSMLYFDQFSKHFQDNRNTTQKVSVQRESGKDNRTQSRPLFPRKRPQVEQR